MRKLLPLLMLIHCLSGVAWAGDYAEDSAHVTGDMLQAMGCRRIDVPASSAGTSGDYGTCNQDANGATWTDNIGKTTKVCAAITPDTAAYQAADIVGGKLTFASLFRAPSNSGMIQSVEITNTEIDGITWDMCVSGADFTTSTVADQGAATITAADLQKIKCFAVNDVRSFATTEVVSAPPMALSVAATGTSLYGIIRTNGAPTWAAAQTVNVCVTVIND